MFSITWRIGDIGRKDSNDRSIKCTGKLSRRRKGREGERERERGKGRREGGRAEDPWVKNDGNLGARFLLRPTGRVAVGTLFVESR